MKKTLMQTSFAIAVALSLTLTSCVPETAEQASSETRQMEATAMALSEADRQIGMPNIVNFQQRKLLKQIFELCDKENLVCYAYLQSMQSGKLIYIGQCIGYGIPFSAQFTNPERIIDAETYLGRHFYQDNGSAQVIPQADPNGLFMPTSSSATWLIMIDPETQEPRPVYFEPTITVSPFKLTHGVVND